VWVDDIELKPWKKLWAQPDRPLFQANRMRRTSVTISIRIPRLSPWPSPPHMYRLKPGISVRYVIISPEIRAQSLRWRRWTRRAMDIIWEDTISVSCVVGLVFPRCVLGIIALLTLLCISKSFVQAIAAFVGGVSRRWLWLPRKENLIN